MSENESDESNSSKKTELEEEIISIPSEDYPNVKDQELKEKISCDFIIKEKIGEGTFSTVKLAINRQTGEKVAIKIMEKSKMIYEEDKNRLEREIEVLKIIRHPNLIHLYSVLKKDDTIYLIMKYIKGIELFDYIVNKTKLTEKEACMFFQQIISGIEYFHKIKYIHRDIKPENILINEDTKELIIVDFGLCNSYSNSNKDLLTSACGSPSYAAPEMLNGEKYRGPPVDIWSCGVVLYAMLCGYLPFEDEDNNNDALYDKICEGKFEIPNYISEKARDLLNKILTTDPKKRLTIYQIKNHPWFSIYDNKGKLMTNDGLILSKIIIPIDEGIVATISKKFNLSEELIRISILSNKHDNISTLYYLFLNKKLNNKKKSEADIKSNLFQKYCQNKNNWMEFYDNDINKVIKARKDGYKNNLLNISIKKNKNGINISDMGTISNKVKGFNPEENFKKISKYKTYMDTHNTFYKKNMNKYNHNKVRINSNARVNFKGRNLINDEGSKTFHQKTFNKSKNLNNDSINLASRIKKEQKIRKNDIINNNSEIRSEIKNKRYLEKKEQNNLNNTEFNNHKINKSSSTKKKNNNNYYYSDVNKIDQNETIEKINKKENYYSFKINSKISNKEVNTDNFEDSFSIRNIRKNSIEPFDLSLIYIKPRKVLKDQLLHLFNKNKIKYRSINQNQHIIDWKKENISCKINIDKLKIINEDKEEYDTNKIISLIKFKKLNGLYTDNLNFFEKIIYKLN